MAIKGDKLDYQNVETECLLAISELKITTSVSDWVNRNASLYGRIIIQPEGLPAIIDESYLGIHKFGRLYEMIKGIFE
jgi:hypothetical protein